MVKTEMKPVLSYLSQGDSIFGLVNFGNTCYCNSVLQSLFHLSLFREECKSHKRFTRKNKIIIKPEESDLNLVDFECLEDEAKAGAKKQHKPLKNTRPNPKNNLLDELIDLFLSAASGRKSISVLKPEAFYHRVRQENLLFAQRMQHDAHEFLSYLISAFDEIVEKVRKAAEPELEGEPNIQTWIKDLFEGEVVTETKCLCCETKRHRSEKFLDLKLDVEINTSLMHSLGKYFETETLKGQNKFRCERCRSLQEAEKRLFVTKLPRVIVVQLKRFKYVEKMQNFKKVPFRHAFPFMLRFPPEFCDTEVERKERLYELVGVVIHLGSGPNHGHYVSVNKIGDVWVRFDDERVSRITENDLIECFGATQADDYCPRSAYLLFFQEMEGGNALLVTHEEVGDS